MSTPSNQHRQYGDEGPREPISHFCERIIEEAPIGIFQSTFQGRILSANSAMARMLGFTSPAELIKSITDISTQLYVDPEQRASLLRCLSKSHDFIQKEVQYLRQVGSPLIVNLNVRAIRDDTGAVKYIEGFAEDITARKLAEHGLQQSEHKYRELVENANSIILRWSRDGIITFLNEFGLRFFGFTEQEVFGRSVMGTIVPESEDSGRDLRAMIADILAEPQKYAHNINENMRRNGERVWIDWTNKIVFEEQGEVKEILSIGSDITERVRTEEALKESEALFRSLADHANVIIGILQGTKLVYVNPYLVQITGYSQQELLQLDIDQLVAPPYRTMVMERARLRQAGTGQVPSRYEVGILTRDGREIYLDFATARTEYQRKPAIIGIAYDITERKQNEEELRKHREHLEELVRERTTDLEHANTRLRELDRLKSMFIASMSHELRTPLNSIIGFTGMTVQGLSGELNDEQRDNLTRVYQSAKHLLALITDVIDISKIEAGRIETFPTDFTLRALVDEAVQSILPQAREQGLHVDVEVPVDLTLYLDRKRLMQCLLNLLSNAVKFTEAGGITVSARRIDHELALAVTDTGIGIAEEDLPKLFEAFERLETHLRVKVGGTGLGLYLTKKIVTDIFHGQITVQSQVGVGSTFTIRIPLEG